jgi:hypothetical protein
MAAVTRYLEFPEAAAAAAADHPCLMVLQLAWPVLSGVAAEPQCQVDAAVVEALAELYRRALLSTKRAGRPLLAPCISALLGVLTARPHAACLDTLSAMVELFGAVHSEDVRALQVGSGHRAARRGPHSSMWGARPPASLVRCVTRSSHALPQVAALQGSSHVVAGLAAAQHAGSAPPAASSSSAELVAGYFTLADRFLIFARDVFLDAAPLEQLIGWACRCGSRAEATAMLPCVCGRQPAPPAAELLGPSPSAASW